MTDLRNSCQIWLTADGANSREITLQGFAEDTDNELATEMIKGWFSQPERYPGEVYGPDGPPTVEQATAMFADLRSDLDWLDFWHTSEELDDVALNPRDQTQARRAAIAKARNQCPPPNHLKTQ